MHLSLTLMPLHCVSCWPSLKLVPYSLIGSRLFWDWILLVFSRTPPGLVRTCSFSSSPTWRRRPGFLLCFSTSLSIARTDIALTVFGLFQFVFWFFFIRFFVVLSFLAGRHVPLLHVLGWGLLWYHLRFFLRSWRVAAVRWLNFFFFEYFVGVDFPSPSDS